MQEDGRILLLQEISSKYKVKEVVKMTNKIVNQSLVKNEYRITANEGL